MAAPSHSWGGGAYYMEVWGVGALDAGNAEAAEEAFLESLAHDTGSIKGALGMEALCTRMGRITEAEALLWDRTHNTLNAKGPKVIGEGETPGRGAGVPPAKVGRASRLPNSGAGGSPAPK